MAGTYRQSENITSPHYSNEMSYTRGFIPGGSWDCHLHVFDPASFPLRSDRAYTPFPASLESLMSWSPVDNVNIVQATIENGEEGVLAHLAGGRQKWATKNFYVTIVSTLDEDGVPALADAHKASQLHEAGVRCVRVHGGINATGVDPDALWSHFMNVASSPGVTQCGWAIAMQLPLQAWAALQAQILSTSSLNTVDIIADHMGCATPADAAGLAFEQFLDLLRQGRIYVKISALHRRSPGNVHAMKEIVQRLADAGPGRILWGSDWPHVNSGVKTLEPTPHLNIDAVGELELIKSWLSKEQWQNMMVENPRRVFQAGKPSDEISDSLFMDSR